MKTILYQFPQSGFRLILFAGLCAGALPVSGQAEKPPAQDAQSLFERAYYLEFGRGDVGRAVELYREVLADAKAQPELAMRARFQVASCFLKQGDKTAAREVLAELIDTLPAVKEGSGSLPEPRGIAWDQTLERISEMSLVPIEEEELKSLVMEGIAEKLGGYSEYFTREKLEMFQTSMNRRLVGIGTALKFSGEGDRRKLIVSSIVPGSPAEDAGLQAKDEIQAIDGEPVGEDMNQIVMRIRGDEGSKVILSVLRLGGGEAEEVAIVRRPIKLPDSDLVSAPYQSDDGVPRFLVDVEHGIAAIRLRFFTTGISETFGARIRTLQADGMKGLVLDLRGNSGGSMQEALKVAGFFVGNQVVVITESRESGRQEHRGEGEALGDFPVVVLIDDITASAAEIVAACLQDHGRAAVIGRRSFGKGTVETMMPLESGGALKLSVAEFFRPSGTAMKRPEDRKTAEADEAWGVSPDPGLALKKVTLDPDLDDRARFDQDPVWQKAMEHLRKKLAH